MKNFLIGLSLITLALTFVRCTKSECFTGAGAVVREERLLPFFNHIVVSDNINVIITQSTATKIEVETGEFLQQFITTEIVGTELHLKNTIGCDLLRNPGEKVNVYLSVVDFNKIDYYGFGDITTTNTLEQDEFSIETDQGAGNIILSINCNYLNVQIHNEITDIVLTGKADIAFAYTTARGTLDFRNMIIRDLKIDYGSVRNGFFTVTESLHGVIRHKGNVYYKGNPSTVNVQELSSGRFIHQQ